MRRTGTVPDGRPTLGPPIRVPGSTVWMTPFVVERKDRIFESQRPRSIARGSSAARYRSTDAGVSVHWHNALFRDLNADASPTTPLFAPDAKPALITWVWRNLGTPELKPAEPLINPADLPLR